MIFSIPTRSIALVLNLTTGRVSPQFHVQFDPSFQTLKKSFGGKSPPSHWQAVCGFSNGRAKQPVPEGVTATEAGDQREPVFSLEPIPEAQNGQALDEQPFATEPEGDPPDNEE